VVGSENANIYFEIEYLMAVQVQGHPMSVILVPIDSAYATFYWSSVVTLVRFRDNIDFLLKQRPHPYSTRSLGCSPWTKLPMLGLLGAKILNYYRYNYYRSIPTYYMTTNRQRYRRTDRRTDGTIAIPRFALRASR